jgi:putative glutamine amidotransferase
MRAGGEVRMLDYERDSPADVVATAGGILLPGGRDVRPALYGAVSHRAFSAAETGRDEYELELTRRALDADVPVLAICRGVQVLNVARGGTLVQDIPDELPGALNHTLKEPPFAIAHDVRIAPGSRLERLLRDRIEGEGCAVNSRHHQAVNALGEGFVVTATARDGVIEAIEHPDSRFCVGVQWHPENFFRTGEFHALFEAFVAASRR